MQKSIHLLGLRRKGTENKQKRACLFLVNKHNYFGYNYTRLSDGDMPVRSNESVGRVQMPRFPTLGAPTKCIMWAKQNSVKSQHMAGCGSRLFVQYSHATENVHSSRWQSGMPVVVRISE